MGVQSVITNQTVADRFGLHTTDLECLDLICLRKDPTAGELAKATGLTSGAVKMFELWSTFSERDLRARGLHFAQHRPRGFLR